MKKIKTTAVLLFLCLSGCSTLRSNSPQVTNFISSHSLDGASSVEVMAESLTKSDFRYLDAHGYYISTNSYVSCGEVVKFVEIKW